MNKIKQYNTNNLQAVKCGLFLIFIFSSLLTFSYNIKVEIKNCPEYYIYFGKHRGPDFTVIDSVQAVNGLVEFSGKKNLETGVYFIVIPPQTRFDFIIADEQNFTLKTDTRNILGELISNGEKQYQIFLDIQKDIAEINKKRSQLEMESEFYKMYQKDTIPYITAKIDSLNQIQFDIYETYKTKLDKSTFVYDILSILSPFHVPDSIAKLQYEEPAIHYRYYIDHYLDRINFDNPSILNTPEFVFHKLLADYCYYFFDVRANKLDDAYQDMDNLIAKTENKPEFRQYILSYLVSRYEKPQDLRLESFLVYLYRNYFMINRPDWVTDQAFDIMKLRIESVQYNLVGSIGKNLVLNNQNGDSVSIYGLESNYKVLFFWEPSCDICTDAILKLKEEYSDLEAHNVQVFAVCTNSNEINDWKSFINDKQLNWINAIDIRNSSNFEIYYGTYKTPRLFILDSNNKILTKDVKPDYVYEYIKSYEEHLEKERGRFDFMFGE